MWLVKYRIVYRTSFSMSSSSAGPRVVVRKRHSGAKLVRYFESYGMEPQKSGIVEQAFADLSR